MQDWHQYVTNSSTGHTSTPVHEFQAQQLAKHGVKQPQTNSAFKCWSTINLLIAFLFGGVILATIISCMVDAFSGGYSLMQLLSTMVDRLMFAPLHVLEPVITLIFKIFLGEQKPGIYGAAILLLIVAVVLVGAYFVNLISALVKYFHYRRNLSLRRKAFHNLLLAATPLLMIIVWGVMAIIIGMLT